MEKFLIISLAVASVSYTVTQTPLFKPFRDLVGRIHPKIDQLFHCPYCFGHWLTFAVIWYTDNPISFVKYGYYYPAIDFLISSFAVMGAAAVLHFLIVRAYEPIIREQFEREMRRAKNAANKP